MSCVRVSVWRGDALVLVPLKPGSSGARVTWYVNLNPLPSLVLSDRTRIYGTVASSPRAVTDRLLGCVGTVRVDRY